MRGQAEWKASDAVEVIPGFDLYGGFWWFEFASAVNFESADDPLAEREPVGFDGQGNFWSPDPFVKVNLRPLDDHDRWLITPGLRLNTTFLSTGGEVSGALGARTPPHNPSIPVSSHASRWCPSASPSRGRQASTTSRPSRRRPWASARPPTSGTSAAGPAASASSSV